MADMTLDQLQALVELQGQKIAKLEAAAAATTPAPTEYYTLTKTGEEIDEILAGGGGSANAVRYDEAQSLTTDQQAQARKNIAAMQGIESADSPGCYYVLNGSIVEWINPPVTAGVEYRTTERYLGKPVYCKLIDCGNLPAPGASISVAHGVSGCRPVSITARMSNSNTIPWLGMYNIGADNANVIINAPSGGSNLSALTAVALMRYTKSTD